MTSASRTRLAVLGAPIAHSKSPALHEAAYGALRLPWSYEAIEMLGADLPGFLGSCGSEWRGLSLTMPLKRDVLPMLDHQDALVDLTGGANTVLMSDDDVRGFNTDVYGITRTLEDNGGTRVSRVQLLGAGATAASVIVAVARMGAEDIRIAARSESKARPLVSLIERLGIRGTISGLHETDARFAPDLVVSTLPGTAAVDVPFPGEVLTSATFFDVAYAPWPTPLASRWLQAGGNVIGGLEMLVNQALGQVRIFVTGSADVELDDERLVLGAMRASVELGPAASVS